MHVIWKRPDGFHAATPTDYSVVELGGKFRLWLHNTDKDQYPFRVSGGWEERESTIKLNNFVNLLPKPKADWLEHLVQIYNHSMKAEPNEFHSGIVKWLDSLKEHVKGDEWELEILHQAINTTKARIVEVQEEFVKRTKPKI